MKTRSCIQERVFCHLSAGEPLSTRASCFYPRASGFAKQRLSS
ncbi:hypothetical protein SGRIM119S_00909 [Streptomyces griseorubiginosus]